LWQKYCDYNKQTRILKQSKAHRCHNIMFENGHVLCFSHLNNLLDVVIFPGVGFYSSNASNKVIYKLHTMIGQFSFLSF
jgi:hypothetical protein